MSQDPLHDALRSLPRSAASPHFTTRLMARTREVSRANPLRRPAYAIALTVMAAITATTHFVLEERRERTRLELLAEQQQLVHELAELKALASESSGVVYLGGNDEVDLLLDLGTTANAQARPAGASLQDTPQPSITSGESK